MSFRVARGVTLLIPTSKENKHLHIVMCDPFAPSKKASREVLVVPVSTYRQRASDDDACFLQSDDHSFIKHLSYVKYEFAKQYLEDSIVKMVAKDWYQDKGMLAEHVFQRVADGFDKSRFTKRFVREYLRNQYQG